MPDSYGQPPNKSLFSWRRMRADLRNTLFRFVEKLFATDDGQKILDRNLRNVISRRNLARSASLSLDEQPYADLGRPFGPKSAAMRRDAIIITARFRTGSTLLWNLFRHIPGTTA